MLGEPSVGRWERGETEPQPWFRPKLARALVVSVEELHHLLAAGEPLLMKRSRFLAGAALTLLAHQWLVRDPEPLMAGLSAGRVSGLADQLPSMIATLRTTDDAAGGGTLCSRWPSKPLAGSQGCSIRHLTTRAPGAGSWKDPGGAQEIAHLKLGDNYLETFWYKDQTPAPETAGSLATDLPRIGVKHFALQVKSVQEARKFVEDRGIGPNVQIRHGKTGVSYVFIKDPSGYFG